jgi:hypothetical protein
MFETPRKKAIASTVGAKANCTTEASTCFEAAQIAIIAAWTCLFRNVLKGIYTFIGTFYLEIGCC